MVWLSMKAAMSCAVTSLHCSSSERASASSVWHPVAAELKKLMSVYESESFLS